MNGNGSEQMPGEAVATKKQQPLSILSGLRACVTKSLALSEQERGRDLCRGQSSLDLRLQLDIFYFV